MATSLIIGLTGGIGSGKTLASDWFGSQGIDVIDADVISHAITAKGSPILDALKDAFGAWVLSDTGELNRPALRQHVFANPSELDRLNAIMHPAIRQAITDALSKANSPYAILSAPLLLESIKGNDKGLTALCQRILVIDVPESVQRQRASGRDGQTLANIQAIMDKQLPRQQRLSLADDVADNSGDKDELYRQLERLHHKYLELAKLAKQKGRT